MNGCPVAAKILLPYEDIDAIDNEGWGICSGKLRRILNSAAARLIMNYPPL